MDLASEQTGALSRTLLRGSRPAKRWAHVLGLAVVLFGLLLFTHPGVAISSDEGAAILEGRQVLATGRWLYVNPLPTVDPSAAATPFPHGDRGTKGLAAYAKHPLYPILLGLADRLGGSAGLVLLTLLGTLLAALGAACVAGRIDPRLWVAAL